MAIVDEGLRSARRVIVVIGSTRQARSLRDPFTFTERAGMIAGAHPGMVDENRLLITPALDYLYSDNRWVEGIQAAVQGIVCQYHVALDRKEARIGLIGHSKDHTSYYLKLFPRWIGVDVQRTADISGTAIRDAYFGLNGKILDPGLPESTRNFLTAFAETEAFRELTGEAAFVRAYKDSWANAPYPPTFVTVDAVVVQAGHLLLVRRRARPGAGLLALPGGFVGQYERIKDAIIREIIEETRIKVPRPMLEGSMKDRAVFDSPYRSSRGRTITHAFLIELPSMVDGLAKIRGGDDAASANWVPLGEIDPETLFEDHYQIIQSMLGRLHS
jgi:bifunctional NMN adenylyltransferase/nudix hydrolase